MGFCNFQKYFYYTGKHLSFVYHLEHSAPAVTVSMMAGAMRARVELDTEPTSEMNRSSCGTSDQ